ncbi:MAG: putative zinc-binding metallopeptidase [Planctomycetaceae bacterium]|nr:putative zinc-binding metallopeptidase [Planctomycetaceae bacterium]
MNQQPSLRSVLLTACLLCLSVARLSADERISSDTSATITLQQLQRRLNVQILMADEDIRVELSTGPVTAVAISGRMADNYLSMLVEEFAVYPPAFVRRAKLKRIVVCQELAYDSQRRAAVPDFEHDTLYLDWQSGASDRHYQRAVMHHEFFHIVDYQDDGFVYDDKVWQQLNPDDFRYGPGGSAVQDDARQSDFRRPTAGFLTHYSTAGVEEDKAELFAHLIASPLQVAAAVEQDARLDSKVAHLKASLRSFCGDMDAAFWKRVNTSAKQRAAADSPR